MFHVSGAMFAISANYLISSIILRHPKEFAKIMDPKSTQAQIFKNTGSPKDIKNYILSTFAEDHSGISSLSRKASKTVTKALLDSDNDNDSESTTSASSSSSSSSDIVEPKLPKKQQPPSKKKDSSPSISNENVQQPPKSKRPKTKQTVVEIAEDMEQDIVQTNLKK
ncbi:Hypothetical predicted protein [Paramuricea clavata]|uniref:Uncharacterized protein n=1 Tax=Paramuricea clavata TaxID=317549 RepID=A0A7D9E3D8_PARCT|nr:Hypothetical predicted protein [Paramuricea clavata]